ncbi:substrate-binding domain-containing protein [Microbacterium hominis]|uniref:Substrate-binding domain-containing protein n=1 Tax=Microbacterium hominis TaxID=162426 RepID=A0A7D4TPP5_9MICO|nr:substrate-binding domain-containing protein [Microbacterium hominis]
MKTTVRSIQVVMVGAAIAFAITACSDGGATPDETGGSTTAEMSPEAQAALERAYEGIGSDLADLAPTASGDALNLYVVSCGEQIPGCAVPAAAAAEAGEIAGWTATVADGKLNPEGFATAIRQAIAGGADIIVPIGIGCGIAQAAFQEAVDAGITIVGGGGVDDCEPKLWAAQRLWLSDYTPIEQWNAFGQLQADYAFGKTDGDVKPVVLNFTGQVWGPWITDGFLAELEELGGSGEALATIDISDPEVADGSFVQKVTTALLAEPDANVLIVPIDAWLTNGLAAAIVQAGLDEQLLVVSRAGDAPALDLIRQGGSGIDATIGSAVEWGAWGSIDTALRVLAGEQPVDIGESMQAIDADHNMVDSGSYQGSVDFRDLFSTAWGAN